MPADFSTDSAIRAQLWHLRKGIIPAVGETRPQGTNALLEDIVVPVPALARTCMELIRLFDKYNYCNCMIFGHAKDGNVSPTTSAIPGPWTASVPSPRRGL
ncbi:FAD-binding oxidoreductase [Cryobacterium sp. Y11]|uniref:FAD-binding oxidoreductase n=1 Tax=Cryobacterium sp. Y11 TaxID=2045016 RepID=UPI001E51B401|nr:FAD-linked oxidase C-terminal domain-containing protein [Cryobacterium sp. Y11]